MQVPWQDAVWIDTAGAVLIDGTHIGAVGDAEVLQKQHPQVPVTHYGPDHLICPGFIDAHAHYPQTGIIASWGKRLIDWLDTYTFPEEARFDDTAYASEVAERYLDLTLSHGTTTVATYCTIHPGSVEAIFDAAAARQQRIVAGKTCMNCASLPALCDTAQSAYDDSKALIDRWHGKGRAIYAITPRFALTSCSSQLFALGALWAENPTCLMQTHLSEQPEEIRATLERWGEFAGLPRFRDYLDIYELHELVGPRAVFGHAIHLEPREIDRLAETGASVVHCPTSNTFIGSGLFDMAGLSKRGIPVGLATDTGGGSSFSMLRTMAAAYEIAQLRGNVLHPAQLLWLATAGSARSLHLHDQIGTLAEGHEADITVLSLASTPAIEQRATRAEDAWEQVFPTIMMGDDRAIADIWVNGVRQQFG